MTTPDSEPTQPPEYTWQDVRDIVVSGHSGYQKIADVLNGPSRPAPEPAQTQNELLQDVPKVWCAFCGQWGYHKSGYCPLFFVESHRDQSSFDKFITTAFLDGWREGRASVSTPSAAVQPEFYDQQRWREIHRKADGLIATKSGKLLAALYRSPDERLREDYDDFVQIVTDWAVSLHERT